MSDQRPTPETDAASWADTNQANALTLASFSRQLELQRDEARNELEKSRFALRGAQQGSEEARKAIQRINRELDEARELAVDLQSSLITTLASLIIRMGPEDVDTVENAHHVLGKAKQLLKP
jgi:hypothetical protein